MANAKSRGCVLGAVAAASYGLNPLFTLPLYGAGMGVDSVLFYRYLLAAAMLGALMLVRRQSFAVRRRDLVPLAVMGLLFSFSSLFLFESYNHMDAGIASTILFLYPVLVAVIMAVGFHEKVSRITMLSILLAFTGIAMLYKGGVSRSPFSASRWFFSRRSAMRSTSWASTARRCAACRPRNSPFTPCCSA